MSSLLFSARSRKWVGLTVEELVMLCRRCMVVEKREFFARVSEKEQRILAECADVLCRKLWFLLCWRGAVVLLEMRYSTLRV